MEVLILALFIVALFLGIIEQIRARGASLTDWAVIAIAVGLLLARLA